MARFEVRIKRSAAKEIEESVTIQRTADAATASVENMGVDHRGLDAGMAQELLHRPDVVAVLQQMSGEAVAERGGRCSFLVSRLANGVPHRFLDRRRVEMVTALPSGPRIDRQSADVVLSSAPADRA